MTKKQQFATPFTERKRTPFFTEGETMAQQHFRKECDIREIIKRNDRTGIVEHVNRGIAQYADVSDVKDYKAALEMINTSMESFMGLPSDIRKLFDNDPGEFFEFATNPANGDEMVKLGLAPSPAPAAGDAAPADSAPESVDTEKSED
jgi:phage internal scaffolding protein